jgi:ATP/maltotriose-dependent transcriptional regulator MalT
MARRVSSPQIVGREETLAALEAALGRAIEGDPGVVLLAGEAGVGKTRVARELAERAGDARVLWGECVPLQAGELPFAPLIAALRPLGRTLDELAPAASGTPAQLFERVLGLLAEESPALLVIEDVHWADEAMQDLLRFLVRNLRGEPVLLVLTHRTDESVDRCTALLAELARRARLDLDTPAPAPAEERPFDLTPRELTVLELLAAGRTNRNIAEELFLSRRTVDMHVRNILAKLNAGNRVEAAGMAHELGLV